ncbi:MAG TPA: acylphosphatase [Synergistaceae bacterium]|jgi:acylphosphatase|nr:MAG: Acylphosphatase [Synergistales bacterium 57_84]KUK88569.1 MAG: Acylphosphatase [Synergistales bacterium 58_81]HBG14985.1 acylphosphatase [Synergistaceae bacterium]HCP07540.1 acylphosphatase [Synergistaceae bacterium]HCR38868.1 acylphosphatase [Synergistaceae bacterium]
MGDHKCVRVIITGIVQGVGFRWRARRTAMALDVHGWIRNRPDGSVEAVLQGPSNLVDEMLDWVSKGPPGAVVMGITTSPCEADPDLPDFQILGSG